MDIIISIPCMVLIIYLIVDIITLNSYRSDKLSNRGIDRYIRNANRQSMRDIIIVLGVMIYLDYTIYTRHPNLSLLYYLLKTKL